MVAIESHDLTRRLDYIIVGIEVAKTAVGQVEDEALDEISREYIAATEQMQKPLKTPKKKRGRPKKVNK